MALALCLFVTVTASAQLHARPVRQREADAASAVVKAYADSLAVLRSRLDSAAVCSGVGGAGVMEGRYYRLFAPVTFYHDIAARQFDIAATDSLPEADRALEHVYMSRPDLVWGTQRQLDNAGHIISPTPSAVTPNADIVDIVAPKPKDDAVFAPIDIYVEKPNFWTFSGDYSLQLFQNYVSDNWYKGGESNYSMLTTVTLQANYNNKQKLRWDNKLEMRLGLQSTRGDTLHDVRASEDLLRYTGKIGLQASHHWYYTVQLIASTQFMRGLKSNDPTVYSDFLSPFTLNPSLGMDYNLNWLKGRLTGSVHLAPIAYTYTFVRKKSMATRYGIDDGHRSKDDFGSEVTVDLTWQFTKDIRWKTRLYGYTTYKRMLMEWENTFTFIVNKYISANVFLYPRFDDAAVRDSHHGYWQLKEYVSLGFNYGF